MDFIDDSITYTLGIQEPQRTNAVLGLMSICGCVDELYQRAELPNLTEVRESLSHPSCTCFPAQRNLHTTSLGFVMSLVIALGCHP